MPLFGRLSSVPRMNGYNFTERVRNVLAAAREQAARLQHEYVGTEHILLALVAETDCVSSAVLESLGADPRSVAATVDATVKRGKAGVTSGPDLPYTSRAKKVLELAMSEARGLRHAYVGTEHLLLGLVAEANGIGAQVLRDHGVTLETARRETARILGAVPPSDALAGGAASADPAATHVTSPADRVREEVAWARLRNAVELSARLGATPTLALQEDGTLAVSLGPDLAVTVDFPPSVRLRPRGAGEPPPA